MRVFLCLLLLASLASCKKDDGPIPDACGDCAAALKEWTAALGYSRIAECGNDTAAIHNAEQRREWAHWSVNDLCEDAAVVYNREPYASIRLEASAFDCSQGEDSLIRLINRVPTPSCN